MSDNLYGCRCGCLALFEKYEEGYEIYIGDNKCLFDNKMRGFVWSDYITMNEYKTWGELKADIILNYNNEFQYDNSTDFMPWIHLYNKYCKGTENDNENDNDKLYYDYVF